jgi:hypothetical protein
MPITATMLDTSSSDLFFDYLEDFYDDNNFYDDSKPRRKESQFLKYLITETFEIPYKKRKKRLDDDDEEIEEIPDDELPDDLPETITSTTTTLLPLATKELKRRKTIDFMYNYSSSRPQPYSYTYPTIPILSIRNMRPKSSGATPVVNSGTFSRRFGSFYSVNAHVTYNYQKEKTSRYWILSSHKRTPTTQCYKSSYGQVIFSFLENSEKFHRKVDEDSDGGFDDMKLSDLINEPSHSASVDTSFAERIVECLRDVGGKGNHGNYLYSSP